MWHLLHGPNDIARDEELAKMKAMVGDPAMASLNITVLDSGALLKDIEAACDTVSFLAERRLVILRNWLTKTGGPRRKAGKESDDTVMRLIAYLPELPETTALVFLEDGTIADTHPLVKLAQEQPSHGRVKLFKLPDDAVRWISDRAKGKGGEIAPAAAQLLATKINRGEKVDRDHYAEDSRLYLRKLDNELEKLAAFATGRRIEPADVELLVADEEVSDMFKFIDAVSVGDGKTAYRTMRGVLQRGESPLVIMTMLARQTRLLILAKEHESLSADQLAQTIHVHPFVAKKLTQQVRRFAMRELERAHGAILQADISIKTGRMDDVTALDALVALLCANRG